MTRILRYILVHAYGMAPCPDGGLITLGTCKPVIRRTARPGDWVMGFRPGSAERGLLLWAGKVSAILPHADYQRRHSARPDAVYRERPDGSFERTRNACLPTGEVYHPEASQMRRDLSGPVLLFDRVVSRYLSGRPVALPGDLAHLAPAGQGHRVNDVRQGDPARLETWIATLIAPSAPLASAYPVGCGARRRRNRTASSARCRAA